MGQLTERIVRPNGLENVTAISKGSPTFEFEHTFCRATMIELAPGVFRRRTRHEAGYRRPSPHRGRGKRARAAERARREHFGSSTSAKISP